MEILGGAVAQEVGAGFEDAGQYRCVLMAVCPPNPFMCPFFCFLSTIR